MPDRPCKAEERAVARLLGGQRYPASTGGYVDVEGPGLIAQVKHRRTLSLAALEALAVELASLGRVQEKIGIVVVKRRAGKGRPTPRLVVLTEDAWRRLRVLDNDQDAPRSPVAATSRARRDGAWTSS